MQNLRSLVRTPRQPWAFKQLPVLPATAIQLIDLLDDPESSIHDIVGLLRRAPSISAELLRVANSAHYRRGARVVDLRRAVAIIGLRQARRLALAFSVRGLVSSLTELPSLRTCWVTSISTAILSEALAEPFGIRPEKAYTAGLIHNIGSLALCAAYPDVYAQMLELSQSHELDLIASERELFDTDHCTTGAWLVERYGLPSELGQVASSYHVDSFEQRDLVTLVRGGRRLADLLGVRPTGSVKETLAVRTLVDRLPIDRRELAMDNLAQARRHLLEAEP